LGEVLLDEAEHKDMAKRGDGNNEDDGEGDEGQ